MNAKRGVIQERFMLGYSADENIIDSLVFEVSGNALYRNDVQIYGNTTFGSDGTSCTSIGYSTFCD